MTAPMPVRPQFDKVDSRFEKMEARFDRMDAKFETKIDAIARDLVDVKVSVARIEGYLESQGGFLPAGKDRTSPDRIQRNARPATGKPTRATPKSASFQAAGSAVPALPLSRPPLHDWSHVVARVV